MNSMKHLILSGLLVASACETSTEEDTGTELSASAASELSQTQVDGEAGVGPRPIHQLIRDCSALPDHPGGRGRRGPPPNRAGTDAGVARPLHGFAALYDADDSGALDDAESAALEADRLAGCEARNARLLAAHDTNGDGALDDAELEAAQAVIDAEREARRAEAIAAYDADGDGALSREERGAMRDEKQAALIAEFDADGDGALSEAEEDTLAESIKAEIRAGTAHGGPRGHR